jgi:hypothetical protein
LRLTADRPDIRVVDGPPLRPRSGEPHSACDCYVSSTASPSSESQRPRRWPPALVIATAYRATSSSWTRARLPRRLRHGPRRPSTPVLGDRNGRTRPRRGGPAPASRLRASGRGPRGRRAGARDASDTPSTRRPPSRGSPGEIRAQGPRPAPAFDIPPWPACRRCWSAAAYLSHGPEISWDTPSRLGVAGAVTGERSCACCAPTPPARPS